MLRRTTELPSKLFFCEKEENLSDSTKGMAGRTRKLPKESCEKHSEICSDLLRSLTHENDEILPINGFATSGHTLHISHSRILQLRLPSERKVDATQVTRPTRLTATT